MAILIKSFDKENGAAIWGLLEFSGDLEMRSEKQMNENFIGDFSFNKYGQPMLIIGHQIMYGKVTKIDKPFLVIEKLQTKANVGHPPLSQLDPKDRLDTTISIENKSELKSCYQMKALIKFKVVFKSRPKPIIWKT